MNFRLLSNKTSYIATSETPSTTHGDRRKIRSRSPTRRHSPVRKRPQKGRSPTQKHLPERSRSPHRPSEHKYPPGRRDSRSDEEILASLRLVGDPETELGGVSEEPDSYEESQQADEHLSDSERTSSSDLQRRVETLEREVEYLREQTTTLRTQSDLVRVVSTLADSVNHLNSALTTTKRNGVK